MAFDYRAALQQFVDLRIPKQSGESGLDLGDADADLYRDAAEVTGLALDYLAGGHVDAETIRLDSTIDRRLTQAAAANKDQEVELEAFRFYRGQLIATAHMLSLATGLPVQHVDRRGD